MSEDYTAEFEYLPLYRPALDTINFLKETGWEVILKEETPTGHYLFRRLSPYMASTGK